jgi:hypothetical protein
MMYCALLVVGHQTVRALFTLPLCKREAGLTAAAVPVGLVQQCPKGGRPVVDGYALLKLHGCVWHQLDVLVAGCFRFTLTTRLIRPVIIVCFGWDEGGNAGFSITVEAGPQSGV